MDTACGRCCPAGLLRRASRRRRDCRPIDEKFHFPLGSFSIITCGFTIEISVTFTCFEKISGIISTPTLTFFAVRNGPELNFGSSLIDRSSIPSEPLRIDKLKFPTVTLRPSASDRFLFDGRTELVHGNQKG